MTLRIGDRVTCIDASPAPDGVLVPLMYGATYTVCGIEILANDSIGLRLRDVRFAARPFGLETLIVADTFRADRFRPAVTRKARKHNPERDKLYYRRRKEELAAIRAQRDDHRQRGSASV